MHLPAVVIWTAALWLPLTLPSSVLRSLDHAPVLHFTLARRGGKFSSTEHEVDYVNMTYLSQELEKTERRFEFTQRQVKGNKLVRKAKSNGSGGEDKGLTMGDAATDGIWFAKINIGDPPQEIEMDLNMLVSDFYVVTTTSRKGSRYDDYFSKSIQKSLERPYPTCFLHSELFRLPTVNTSLRLPFALCRPSKFGLHTLGASGSTLGLAPSEHLSQTGSSLLKLLLSRGVVKRPVFSLMLINGHEGVLSIGGTATRAIEMVMSQTETELDRLGGKETAKKPKAHSEKVLPPLIKRGRNKKGILSRQADWEEGFAWSGVQGADGWWQLLMRGVWVDGSRVLRNQAVVVDINSPFILAPPLATKAFYASVSGSRPLPPPFSNFYVFPCLNPPKLHFEFGGSMFPFMQGGRGAEWSGVPGGKFSLGRLEAGSGYCVGGVVETRMGVKEERDEVVRNHNERKSSHSIGGRGGLGGNGMRDVWVIGEGFFRGVGGVFDFVEHRVGFRAY